MNLGIGIRFRTSVKVLVGGDAEGEVLFVDRPISFLGDLDIGSGSLTGYGSIRGKLLVFSGSSGSTVGPYIIYSLAKKSLAPAAMVVRKADTLLITGCVLSNVPMCVVDDWFKLTEVLRECVSNRCFGRLLSDEGVLIIE